MAYKRKSLYILTDDDWKIMQAAKTNGSLFTRYYLNDFEMSDWQLKMHHAAQKSITVVGGFGSGKTVGVAMSAIVYATTVPGFRFMNLAPLMIQTRFMHESIQRQWRSSRWWERFVTSEKESPYPEIDIGYRIPPSITGLKHYIDFEGNLTFLSLAGSAGTSVWSWEGDWINVDEAGQLDDLDDTLRNLASRFRGHYRGRPHMGRLSITTNSWDNEALWYQYDKGLDPELSSKYLSITCHSAENPGLSEDDLETMEERIGGDTQRWLAGGRPVIDGEHFSGAMLASAYVDWLDNLLQEQRKNPTKYPERELRESRKDGITTWSLPYDPTRMYAIFGDPGQGNAPKRNAPVILVFDITTFSEPDGRAYLWGFWWGQGNGQYQPFVDKFRDWKDKYHCMTAAYDSTGTQVGFQEIWRLLEMEFIQGVNLSATYKAHGLTYTKRLMEHKKFGFPRISGIFNQLGRYKLPDDNIAQDIVTTIMIASIVMAGMYYEVNQSDSPMAERRLAKQEAEKVKTDIRSDFYDPEWSNRGGFRTDGANSRVIPRD